jgi:hypothetical protein
VPFAQAFDQRVLALKPQLGSHSLGLQGKTSKVEKQFAAFVWEARGFGGGNVPVVGGAN